MSEVSTHTHSHKNTRRRTGKESARSPKPASPIKLSGRFKDVSVVLRDSEAPAHKRGSESYASTQKREPVISELRRTHRSLHTTNHKPHRVIHARLDMYVYKHTYITCPILTYVYIHRYMHVDM